MEKFDPLRGGLEQWTYRLVQKLAAAGARDPRGLAGILRPGRRLAAGRPPGPPRAFPTGLRRRGGGETGFPAAGRDPRHGGGLVLRHFPPARRLVGLGDGAEGVAAATLAAAAEKHAPSCDAAVSHLPQADGAAVRRPRPDHGGAVADRVADDFARFHQVAPRADPHRLQRRGRRALLAGPLCAAPRRRCAAAWGSAPTRCSCCWWPQIFPLKGIATLLRSLAPFACAGACRCDLLVVGGKRPAPGGGSRRGWAWPRRSVSPRRWRTSFPIMPRPTCTRIPRSTTRAAWWCWRRRPAACPSSPPAATAPPNCSTTAATSSWSPIRPTTSTLPPRSRGCSTPAARRALGEAARRTAVLQSFDRNVDNIVALYEEVVERRARLAGDPLVWSGASASGAGPAPAADADTPATGGRGPPLHGIPQRRGGPAMKIGLVIDCFDPRRGGAQEWTRQYAQRLLARGHEVHVVTQSVGRRGAAAADRRPLPGTDRLALGPGRGRRGDTPHPRPGRDPRHRRGLALRRPAIGGRLAHGHVGTPAQDAAALGSAASSGK